MNSIWLQHLVNKYFSLCIRQKPKIDQFKSIKLVAHRGVHNKTNRLENTYAAFDKALELGIWGIEFDIQTTKDYRFIINHDPTLSRLWHVDKKIIDHSEKELLEILPTLPTLSEMINRYAKQLHLFIELKAPFNNFHNLAIELSHLTPVQDYHLISLNPDIFSNLSYFPKNCLLLIPTMLNHHYFCQLSLKNQYGGILGHYLLLRNRYVSLLRGKKQVAEVGFIESKYSLYREIHRGMHWIFTDHIEKIIRFFP